MKFGTDIHVPLRMNCNNFGDLSTFYVAPLLGQNCHLFNSLIYEQIPEN